jgi:hypothetical protein
MTTLARALAAGLLSAVVAFLAAPAAVAEPVPGPEPVPVPAPVPIEGTAGCQGGEVMQDGNCVPTMAPVTTTGDGDDLEHVPLRYTETETTTTASGIGADLVPNINGYPCTGYWQSMACVAEGEADMPAVQPRSTLSSSP